MCNYFFYKTIAFSIICGKCFSNGEKVFQNHLIEILKTPVLINEIGEYQKDINNLKIQMDQEN